jgi:GalNAc-alpha-(1->4)-GalNAc-alpha-(1->3)-diNAcBac-PP-undecaprenol alpha-1,4-N-acetyl-D-galactosaminyltransferase
MRILLAIPSLRCGGSERVMTTLATHWLRRGYDVSLATFESPETDFFAVDPAARRFVLGETGAAGVGWLAANRDRVRALRSAVRQSRADVVLSFLYTMNLLAVVAARGRAPVVVAERTDPRYFPIERWQAALRRVLYPAAAALVVQTEAVRTSWARRIAPRSPVFAIPNPVLPPALHEWRGPALPPLFVAGVGRLERGKGFDILLEAFARVARSHPQWGVVVLGEGPERAALTARAEHLGLGGRFLAPGVGDSSALLARASVFATATRVEGFPNALLEAMAHGLPVVSTDCPSGPREIVRPGVDGYLVPVDDPAALAAALEQLFEDEKHRQALGTNARSVVDRYSVERVAAAWEHVLNAVSRKGAPA